MDGDLANRTQAKDLTRNLATQASAVSYDALPDDVRALARQCVLDYYGVALAGADDPLVAMLLDELIEAGGNPQASLIGRSARLPALSAALVNGAIGHALDYDDVNLAMPGHPSVAILPGLLALAEQRAEQRARRDRGVCRRLRDRLPDRLGHASGPLRSRLSRDRHGRLSRRRRRLRPAPRTRRRGHRAGARHCRHAGCRAQVAIRHDVQAVPRRQGVAERSAGGASRGSRVFEPARPHRMRAGFCPDARPRFPPGEGARRPAARVPHPRESLQVPRRLLPDARADRNRPRGSR